MSLSPFHATLGDNANGVNVSVSYQLTLNKVFVSTFAKRSKPLGSVLHTKAGFVKGGFGSATHSNSTFDNGLRQPVMVST